MSISKNSKNIPLDTKRHSFAHIMASAVKKMFPEAQFGVGPVIENGCYYDFILPRTLIPEDLPLIESHIKDLLKRDLVFKRQEVSLEEAISLFTELKQPLKVELLQDLATRGTTSMNEEERADFENKILEIKDIKNPDTVLKTFILKGSSLYVHEEGERYIQDINESNLYEKEERLVRDYIQSSGQHPLPSESELQTLLKDEKNAQKIFQGTQRFILNVAKKYAGKVSLLELIRKGEETLRWCIQNYAQEKEKVENMIFSTFCLFHLEQELLKHSEYITQALQYFKKPLTITIYRLEDEKTGEDLFVDLCKGPHVQSIRELKGSGFSLDKFSASYWRGDQERDIRMQRIYTLVFDTVGELSEFQTQREERKKYDHRILGQQLDLFYFSEMVGAGLPLYTAKGTLIKNNLKQLLFQISKKYGVQEVSIPHFANRKLYETSGHASKFAGELFSVVSHYDGDFVLKPVNCPHHTQIFAGKQRSYRELPLRFIESTIQYRDEKPGQIGGLQRTRGFMVDDGHTFCRSTQIKDEVISTGNIIREFYESMGLWGNQWVSVSIRDPHKPEGYIGDLADWEIAEAMLKEVAQELNLEAKICEGEAALYGPKLDFMFTVGGKETQLATIQVDFAMPKRFELSYINEKGESETPVMLHRAILGSYERFIATLLEKTRGNLPFWLAPVQVKLLLVNDSPEVVSYAKTITNILDETVLSSPLKYNELRYELDSRNESLGKKIREATMEKIPVILIVGPKDIESGQVSVRTLEGEKKVKVEEIKMFLENL